MTSTTSRSTGETRTRIAGIGPVTVVRAGPEYRDALVAHYETIRASDAPYFPMPRDPEVPLEPWLTRAGYLDFDRNAHWLAHLDEAEDEVLVGDFFAKRVELPAIGLDGMAQIHITIHPDYRHSGIGQLLFDLYRERFADELRHEGIRRTTGHVFPENDASIKLATSAGFELEGVLHRHLLGVDGRYHDVLAFGHVLIDEDPCPSCASRLDDVIAQIEDLQREELHP